MTPREAQLTEQLEQCQSDLVEARQEIALLRQKIDLLVKRVFGSSSEELDAAQLELLLQSSQTTPVASNELVTLARLEPARPRSRQPRAPRLPDNLPVIEEVIDPEPVKAAPQSWRCIGQEVSEQLDYEPSRFIRRRLIRRTFVHRTDKDLAPITAPLPPSLRERGLAVRTFELDRQLDVLRIGREIRDAEP